MTFTDLSDQIDLAEYLFRRLYQAGVRAVHGVPGDYNLTALDYIVPAGLEWIGNCNELNAGYAADGYARVKGISALTTTFGVGELSAINAVGGAYAEMSPVVHIVGTPPRKFQAQGKQIHHTLCTGDPSDYTIYADMTVKITAARESLTDETTATAQIDRALRECVLQSRPVYIQLPTDMVTAKVSVAPLVNPLEFTVPSNDVNIEIEAADHILRRIYASTQPFLLVDAGASRYGVTGEANKLARITGFPTGTTPFGKSIINETLPNFHGVYSTVGKNAFSSWVKACDLVLYIGPRLSNINTCGFTTIPSPEVAITFDRDTVTVCDGSSGSLISYHVNIKGLMQQILGRLDQTKLPTYTPYPDLPKPRQDLAALPIARPADRLDHATFWPRLSHFFRPGDIIMTETGTSSSGGREFVLPENTQLINSSIWLSIGFMLPAAQGASLAQRDLARAGQMQGRTILFEGDGSFQVTAQELSTVIRKRLDMIIFLINNNGYTIERLIHGWNAEYNDIAPWRYLETPRCFGAPADGSYHVQTARVTTWGELQTLLADQSFQDGSGLRMVEVMLGTHDAPETLKVLASGNIKVYQEKN
ncbi:hypothetical protein EYZ11_009351 [Aspergillus tanneri]|uniref:Pyruvate decarboxylase n=1 Tax=Aspergillus tanneri TaxID=1220188 RepID=A0A4S3J832_9EURO|nr:uncharacterized protein ATNIH1004_008639 [Aspergillus tanneri]KAA8644435.1 hypothetical protein ATNIH1004_008639 [Aspergillus tanneri]THC91183.1 hypothetical protein EYZ11_009351 [Aspergillus tanneri]